MKSRWVEKTAILVLALSGALSIGAMAQTTEPGPGPTEQPDAPMEIGQAPGPDSQPYDTQDQDRDAQPTEAQPGGPSGEAAATTDQGVARISLIHGDISTQRGDSGDWSAAVLNQPMMTGDKISTADGARTEVQLDFANTIRLAANSKANVANLTKKNIQIQLGEGLATYSVSKDSEAEPEIDTPNVSIHPSHHDGVFRIEVHPDGDTIITVRKGEAQIATPQGSTEVREGEMATVRGTSDEAQYKITSAPDRDDWDRWNSDRDHIIRDANSWRHTNRYYTGTQDLDAYGQWKHVDDYGDVWYPNESGDWAPYRNGNWVYQPYYGWTWVGYEPWGWAPYHYGRWLWYGGAWGWWPGPVYSYYRPFWAPAYVSFWGWGGGFGFGVGFGGWGGFGWLPLGPCDYYHPWWGGYRGRFGWTANGWNGARYGGIHPLHNGMRFSNLANLHDEHIGRAMSTVNAGHFGAGRVRAVAATSRQLRGARMMAGNLPVVPSRASLSASGRAASAASMRNGGAQRFFGAHNNIARPASFEQAAASLRQSMQQNRVGAIPAGGRSTVAFGRGPNAVGTMQRPSAGVGNRPMSSFGNRNTPSPSENRGGYRPFNGNTNAQPQHGTSQPGAGENRGGFRPFNPPSENNRSMSGSSMSRGEPQRGTMQGAPQENRGGYRPFTPPSRSEMPRAGSSSPPARSSSGGYWNRTAPSSGSQRGYYDADGRGASRPQLDMRQPIVRSPSYGNSYPRGGYSAPSYGGSRGVPSYGGSRPGYGGSHSAPSGGGGHAPSGGGGGHFGGGGGGHPSGGSGGGGGHSSGGGHSGGGGGHSGHR
jgi:hypothetical protein